MQHESTLVFVHGWSVRSTDTYGKLPERVLREAAARGLSIDIRHVWLTKYVSFHDEVTVADIARAFEAAVGTELRDVLGSGGRFACITHSTGGPVVREWWRRFHLDRRGGSPCPMSHLIMLAPANFGSALAQLGRTRLARVKTWFAGVDPGTGVLDWLELGSPESWDLNLHWIGRPRRSVESGGTFPFVLTGRTIDRRLYDHVNSYTGEPGSDGVVRAASANLNATHIRLVQAGPHIGAALEIEHVRTAPPTAFATLPGCSHSGTSKGILRSVRDDDRPHPTVDAVLRCLSVETADDYRALTRAFERERPTTEPAVTPHSQIIFRIEDDTGNLIGDFDLKLTAARRGRTPARATPDDLPKGFFQDRQRNHRHRGTLTYYVDHAVMHRAASLGLSIDPHVSRGFVHFLRGTLDASPELLSAMVRPDQTTLVDVVMHRVVRDGLVRLERLEGRDDRTFTRQPAGRPIGRDGRA